MISVKYIWDRLAAYGAKYQSGTDIVAYFNSALAEVQIEIFSDFAPIYDQNEKVKTLLDFWVREQSDTSAGTGITGLGTAPEVVNRPLSIGYTSAGAVQFAIPYISETELIASYRIPQRTPSVGSKSIYYRFNSPSTLKFYPEAGIPYKAFYMIYPTAAYIAFTYSSTDDEDIMTYDPTNSQDLEWPESANNLILYKMLEKYSIEVREELLQAYAKYGIIQSASAGEGSKA